MDFNPPKPWESDVLAIVGRSILRQANDLHGLLGAASRHLGNFRPDSLDHMAFMECCQSASMIEIYLVEVIARCEEERHGQRQPGPID